MSESEPVQATDRPDHNSQLPLREEKRPPVSRERELLPRTGRKCPQNPSNCRATAPFQWAIEYPTLPGSETRENSLPKTDPTTVHLNEVANVLGDSAGVRVAIDLLAMILTKPSVEVATVSADNYLESVALTKKFSIGVNNALAFVFMEEGYQRNLPVRPAF